MSETTENYIYYTIGGEYELSWKKLNNKLFTSKKDALESLKFHMIEKGCKEKNLQVLWLNLEQEDVVMEVRNRHKAHANSWGIPMTGYIMALQK